MMYIQRYLCFLFIALLPMACGFQPVYGPQEKGGFPMVSVEKLEGQYAYLLDQDLRTRLQARGNLASGQGEWVLSYALSEQTQPLGINEQASSTYAMLTVKVVYTVRRPQDNKILAQRTRQQRQGYDIVTSTFGSDKTLADARAKAVGTLADAIIQDLVFLSKKD